MLIAEALTGASSPSSTHAPTTTGGTPSSSPSAAAAEAEAPCSRMSACSAPPSLRAREELTLASAVIRRPAHATAEGPATPSLCRISREAALPRSSRNSRSKLSRHLALTEASASAACGSTESNHSAAAAGARNAESRPAATSAACLRTITEGSWHARPTARASASWREPSTRRTSHRHCRLARRTMALGSFASRRQASLRTSTPSSAAVWPPANPASLPGVPIARRANPAVAGLSWPPLTPGDAAPPAAFSGCGKAAPAGMWCSSAIQPLRFSRASAPEAAAPSRAASRLEARAASALWRTAAVRSWPRRESSRTSPTPQGTDPSAASVGPRRDSAAGATRMRSPAAATAARRSRGARARLSRATKPAREARLAASRHCASSAQHEAAAAREAAAPSAWTRTERASAATAA